jgi:hypothetical protein
MRYNFKICSTPVFAEKEKRNNYNIFFNHSFQTQDYELVKNITEELLSNKIVEKIATFDTTKKKKIATRIIQRKSLETMVSSFVANAIFCKQFQIQYKAKENKNAVCGTIFRLYNDYLSYLKNHKYPHVRPTDLKRIKEYFISKGFISIKPYEYDKEDKSIKSQATVLYFNQSFFDAYKIDINNFYQDHSLHVPRVEIYKNDIKRRTKTSTEKFRIIYELKAEYERDTFDAYTKIIKDYKNALENLSDYNISDILIPTFWDSTQEEIVHPIEHSRLLLSKPYCVFGESLEELGRMQYKFQYQSSELRLNTIIKNMDGSYSRLVEHDLKNAQVRIFFQINDRKDIPADIYAVKEIYEKYNQYDHKMLRYLVKKILMIVPNTQKLIHERVGAAIKAYNKKKKPNMIRLNKKEHGAMIEDIMDMLKNSHEGLRELFNRSSEYKTLQNLEARINLEIIRRSLENNMIPLCVHDCWYFAEYHDQELVKNIIQDSYTHVLKEYYPAIEDTSCVIETVYNTNTQLQFEDGTETIITTTEETNMSKIVKKEYTFDDLLNMETATSPTTDSSAKIKRIEAANKINESAISETPSIQKELVKEVRKQIIINPIVKEEVKVKPYNKVDGGEFVGTDSHELWDNNSNYDDASCADLFSLLTQDMVAEQIELDYTDERQLLGHLIVTTHNSDEDIILDQFWDTYKGDAGKLYIYNLYTELANN